MSAVTDQFTISTARRKLANSALFEITAISLALRDQIVKLDACGEVEPLARGMLARVQQLSEAASECIGDAGKQEDDDRLFREIECRNPSAEPKEAGHA